MLIIENQSQVVNLSCEDNKKIFKDFLIRVRLFKYLNTFLQRLDLLIKIVCKVVFEKVTGYSHLIKNSLAKLKKEYELITSTISGGALTCVVKF